MLFFFQKTLFSMWVLILTLQFFVFIAVWNIRYPNITRLVLFELRKISLGEFVDDLQLSEKIPALLGIDFKAKSATEETVGEERLGSQTGVFHNFGPTLLLGSCVFFFIIAVISAVVIISKRKECSSKCRSCITSLKQKVFWNPMIRYVYLNALKLSMASLYVIKADGYEIGAVLVLIALNIAVALFVRVLFKSQSELNKPAKVKSIGSLYTGKNIETR